MPDITNPEASIYSWIKIRIEISDDRSRDKAILEFIKCGLCLVRLENYCPFWRRIMIEDTMHENLSMNR